MDVQNCVLKEFLKLLTWLRTMVRWVLSELKYLALSYDAQTPSSRNCSDTDRYVAVNYSEHLKRQWISPIAKLASQSISPHNLLG
jgi:hypothetical protein